MRILNLILFLATVFSVFARDVTVILIEEDSGKPASGLMVGTMTQNGETICQGEETDTDGTYLLKGIELNSYLIYYGVNGNMNAEFVATPVDSVTYRVHPKYLPLKPGEVEVSANNQYITDEKTVYVPTKRDKKIAYGGSSLLQFMGISSLYIDPMSQKISTASGEAVRTFIDYVPATDQDIANLRPMDVLRVEMFDYPQDPRFRGAAHALNFVMVKYEYGGYTKLDGEQRVVNNKGNYNLSSKFSKGNMTYDAEGNFSYYKTHHTAYDNQSLYSFPDLEISKRKRTTDNNQSTRSGYGTLRAVYNTQKTMLINTIGVNASNQPYNNSTYSTTFSKQPYYTDGTETSMNHKSSVSPSWRGSYLWYLPKDYSIKAEPSLSYGRYSSNALFKSTDGDISTIAKENNIKYSLVLTLQKKIKAHSFSISPSVTQQWDDIKYSGSVPNNIKYRYLGASIGANGYLRFGKYWANLGVNGNYLRTSYGNGTMNEFTPTLYTVMGYTFNSKHTINLFAQYVKWTLSVQEQSPNLVLLSQIDAVQGNERLKRVPQKEVQISYQWLVSNKVNAFAYTKYTHYYKPVTPIYEPLEYAPSPIMIKHLYNIGNYNSLNYGAAITVRLFNNSLSLRGAFDVNTQSRSGGLDMHGTFVSFNLNAYYSWKNFYCSALYRSRQEQIYAATRFNTPQYYNVSIGWGNGNFNVSALIINPFNSSWKFSETIVRSKLYTEYDNIFAADYHRQFALRLSYSFSYGKKIQRTESIGSLSGTSSGIVE